MPSKLQRTGQIDYDRLRAFTQQPDVMVSEDSNLVERNRRPLSEGILEDFRAIPYDRKIEGLKAIGKLFGNAALDFSPLGNLKSAQEAITGTQPLLEGLPGVDSELSGLERIGSGLAALLPFGGAIKKVKNAVKDMGRVSQAAFKLGKDIIPSGEAWDLSLIPQELRHTKIERGYLTESGDFISPSEATRLVRRTNLKKEEDLKSIGEWDDLNKKQLERLEAKRQERIDAGDETIGESRQIIVKPITPNLTFLEAVRRAGGVNDDRWFGKVERSMQSNIMPGFFNKNGHPVEEILEPLQSWSGKRLTEDEFMSIYESELAKISRGVDSKMRTGDVENTLDVLEKEHYKKRKEEMKRPINQLKSVLEGKIGRYRTDEDPMGILEEAPF